MSAVNLKLESGRYRPGPALCPRHSEGGLSAFVRNAGGVELIPGPNLNLIS